MPPFGGPLPPGLAGAPPASGPATAPHGNPGNMMQGMGQLKMALDLLQQALPAIPMGTALHKNVLSAVSNIGKHMSEMQDSPQMKMQNMMQMMQQIKAQQPQAALAGMAGQQGGPPPPQMGGGAPPPQNPPAAQMGA